MSDKKRILVVDDSSNEVRILMEILKDDYAVIAATSGEKSIEIVKGEHAPDLVLMDVVMNGMNGYEACKEIHKIKPNLPVIFVSANTETDEILKGFDAGGIDYITKPIDEKVLLGKVGLVVKFSSKQKSLQVEKEQASDLINMALASAGKLSTLFNFLRAGIRVTEHQELMDEIIRAFNAFSLEGSIQIRGSHTVSGSTQSLVNPLEDELLTRSVNMEQRILQKGSRLIICFESISILVKNMPEDEASFGEIKDNLMLLAEDAHNLNLKLEQEETVSNKRSTMVAEVLQESQAALEKFELYQKEHKENSIKIMDELMTEVESRYFELGLTDDQEQQISKIISDKLHEALEHMEGGLQLDDQMKAITSSLGEIAKSI